MRMASLSNQNSDQYYWRYSYFILKSVIILSFVTGILYMISWANNVFESDRELIQWVQLNDTITKSNSEYIGVIIDLHLTNSLQELSNTIEEVLVELKNHKLKAASFVSFGPHLYYGADHATIDTIVGPFFGESSLPVYSLHGLKGISASEVKESVAKCFSSIDEQFSNCPRILQVKMPNSTKEINEQIRHETLRAIQVVMHHNCCYQCESCICIKKRIQKEVTERKIHRNTNPSGVTLILILFTRIIGFIYPFHRTNHSLNNNDDFTQDWRMYWIIFAMIHLVEDTIFVCSVYIMPFYILAKLLFLGWCVFPSPKNSRKACNGFLHLEYMYTRFSHSSTA